MTRIVTDQRESTYRIRSHRALKSGGGEERGSVLRSGERFEEYKVVRLLGRGGMGTVYHGGHSVLKRAYALKVIRPEQKKKKTALERFKREASVMAELQHEHILTVDEFGGGHDRQEAMECLADGEPPRANPGWIGVRS